MNTEATYERDPDRSIVEPTSAQSSQEPSPLAVHGDPSRGPWSTPSRPISKSGVAWVRPSDLPTMLGSKVIGRGLDLKADLVRRANRPTQPKAPKQKVTRTAIAELEPPSVTHQRNGGLSL